MIRSILPGPCQKHVIMLQVIHCHCITWTVPETCYNTSGYSLSLYYLDHDRNMLYYFRLFTMIYLLDLENVSIAYLTGEEEMEFIRAAMTYVEGGNWTYYIGGSNYNFNINSDIEVTTFSYCPSEYSVNDPGNCIFSLYKYSLMCSELLCLCYHSLPDFYFLKQL